MIDVGLEITYICLEVRSFVNDNLHWLSTDLAIWFSTSNKHIDGGILQIGGIYTATLNDDEGVIT